MLAELRDGAAIIVSITIVADRVATPFHESFTADTRQCDETA
jgi:hypothetical protein